MRIIDLIIGIGWILFWSYWIYKAVSTKRTISRNLPGGITIRLVILVIILFVIRAAPKAWGNGHHNLALGLVGLGLFVAGLALAIWARIYLGRNWGMPMSRKVDADLITSGPYRFIRHPIYSGILLATLATALSVTFYWFIVFAAFAIYFIWSAFVEEKIMASKFPKAYKEYKQKSKMFVPFIF